MEELTEEGVARTLIGAPVGAIEPRAFEGFEYDVFPREAVNVLFTRTHPSRSSILMR